MTISQNSPDEKLPVVRGLYLKLTGSAADAAEIGRDEPRNGIIHIASLTASKIADGILEPKLVLAWLLGALGAPGAAIGALVPIREAGALLPQVILAPLVAAAARRKFFWAAGSMLQGGFAVVMAAAVLTLDAALAWPAILACLVGLSLSRAACSVSHKDALARTVEKTRRGAVSGLAASVGAAMALAFASALALGIIPLTTSAIAIALGVAGLMWIAGGLLFVTLAEAAEPGQRPAKNGVKAFLSPLWRNRQLVTLVTARALLTAVALAPPFIVMASGESAEGRAIDHLGPFMIAASIASILSGYVWGRLSDRSSRQTLMAAGLLGGAGMGGLLAGLWLGDGGLSLTVAVAGLFINQLAHAGVRSGRKIHLTDMSDDETRAPYTALSNTLIGVVLLFGSGFGLLADLAGPAAVFAAFAGMSILSVLVSARLDEVQGQPQES